MKDSSTELLEAIAALRQCYPEWRLGQLIANVAGWADQEVWDVEDKQLLEVIRLHLQRRDTSEKQAAMNGFPTPAAR